MTKLGAHRAAIAAARTAEINKRLDTVRRSLAARQAHRVRSGEAAKASDAAKRAAVTRKENAAEREAIKLEGAQQRAENFDFDSGEWDEYESSADYGEV